MRRSTTRNPDPGPRPSPNAPSRRRRIRRPSAPLLRRKSGAGPDPPHSSSPDSGARTWSPKSAAGVSARKLAAGLWRSESQEIELQSSAALLNPMLERATKWDEHRCKPSVEVYKSFDHLKLLMDQHMAKACTLESKLKAELGWSRRRIGELEAKRRSSKKRLESFLKEQAEAKASWRTREHGRVQSFVDGMRGELRAERKNRRRTEVLNSKLVDELAEARKSARRLMLDYEEERKARELVEEVCDELAKEVREDSAEAEEAKRAIEELEEERKMLRVAETWREERVQMKLLDAKRALQDRHLRVKKLGTQLESFLRSKDRTSSDSAEIIEAELLVEAVAAAVGPQEVEAFAYQPPPAYDDIFAIFEELRHGGEGTEEASPATDIFLGTEPVSKSGGEEEEEDGEWESLSNGDMGSSNDSDDDANGRVSSEVDLALPELDQWSSSDSTDRRRPRSSTYRGMKGCIEWRRGGAHKHSLKEKLLEARLESHKVQIRHVLKQEI